MKTNTLITRTLSVVIPCFCLTGFLITNPESEVADFIKQTQSSMHPNPNLDLGPLPTIEPYEPYVYQAESNNPFSLKDFVTDSSDFDSEEALARCQEEACGDGPPVAHAPYFLESFDLTQISMVGSILDRSKRRVALIQTPNSGIVHAKKGEYIGKNNGLIISIEEDHIVIREKHRVPLGWQNRMAILELFN